MIPLEILMDVKDVHLSCDIPEDVQLMADRHWIN